MMTLIRYILQEWGLEMILREIQRPVISGNILGIQWSGTLQNILFKFEYNVKRTSLPSEGIVFHILESDPNPFTEWYKRLPFLSLIKHMIKHRTGLWSIYRLWYRIPSFMSHIIWPPVNYQRYFFGETCLSQLMASFNRKITMETCRILEWDDAISNRQLDTIQNIACGIDWVLVEMEYLATEHQQTIQPDCPS